MVRMHILFNSHCYFYQCTEIETTNATNCETPNLQPNPQPTAFGRVLLFVFGRNFLKKNR